MASKSNKSPSGPAKGKTQAVSGGKNLSAKTASESGNYDSSLVMQPAKARTVNNDCNVTPDFKVNQSGKRAHGGVHVAKPRPGEIVERDIVGFKLKASVREDSRGRVVIGDPKRHNKPDAYRAYVGDHGEILLVPVKEIPERELWLWQNPEAMAAVRLGLQQSAAGHTVPFDMSKLDEALEDLD
jgi:hypothetical protein